MRKLLLLLLVPSLLYAFPDPTEMPAIGEEACTPCIPTEYCSRRLAKEEICVDLVDPLYAKGVLTTSKGGIVSGRDLRIQARTINYTNNEHQCCIYCEGDLLIDYKKWTLTGDAFFYDFITKTGYLIKGRTAAPPWYIGSKRMELLDNGDLIVVSGYLTTSEGPKHDVRLASPCIRLTNNKVALAKDVRLMVKYFPVVYAPVAKIDMKELHEVPIEFQVGWGGYLASYASIRYKFLDWNDLQGYGRFDGFFQYGIGGGIDTIYNPQDRCTEFYTRNYYAKNIPLLTDNANNRWRYEGKYANKFYKQKISVKAQYDFVKDAQMASEYDFQDFDLKTAGATKLEVRREAPWWIANLLTRVRVNSFQSVNQQLPTFDFNWHPVEIPCTGIISTGDFKASYLHYIFGSQIKDASNFSSARVALTPQFYRPFHFSFWTFTPEIGGKGIYYSESATSSSLGQAQLVTGAKLDAVFYKTFAHCKHAVEPYIHYQYLGVPQLSNSRHYIFSNQDGLGAVSRFRVGGRNSLFIRNDCKVLRKFWFDLWGNLFLKAGQAFPDQKLYLNLEYNPYNNIFIGLNGGWDFKERTLDFANPRFEWTPGENLAFALEYRHRSRYYWRKADFYNFTLENVRSKQELLNSPISDERSTFLARAFVRLSPDWNASADIRRGWDRPGQNPYFEWKGGVNTVLFDHWRLDITYERREARHWKNENRFNVALRLDQGPPKKAKFCPRF